MTIQGSAPAKVILCGEHAVVYGCPALAVPVSQLRATVEITDSADGFILTSAQTNERLTIAHTDHPFIVLCQRLFDDLFGTVPDIRVEIRSQIPPASGFGSGAAVAAALTRAVFAVAGQRQDERRINQYVYDTEKHFHGSPSGIDNTVIVHEKPLYFVKNHRHTLLSVALPLHLIIGNSGSKAITRETVAAVRAQYENSPKETQAIFDRVAQITSIARQSIEAGTPQTLGTALTENHTLLQQLGVSSPQLDNLIDAALCAGALGAKLSGAGRGGNMIALVTDETRVAVRDALTTAGAVALYETTLT